MDTSLITVVEQHDVLGEAPQNLDLVRRECRSRVGHHVLYATLVHGDDVSIAFHHIHAVVFGNLLLGLIQTIQLLFLVVDVRVGRVDIFLLHALCTAVEQSAAEGHHLTTHGEPREYDAAGIAVHQRAIVLAPITETGLQQELLLVAGLLSRRRQG